MPYRQKLQESTARDPEKLLAVWREERSFRIGKGICYTGIILAVLATVADFFWSSAAVIETDLILLLGCSISVYWLKSPHRPLYYWWPTYWAFWLSIIPSLWSTGGLNSPFFGVDLALLYTLGAAMETRNRRVLFYLGFSLIHIPVFYVLHLYYPLTENQTPATALTAVITGVTFLAVVVCVDSLLRMENELSLEFTEYYQNLSNTEESLKKSERQLREAQALARMGHWEWDLAADHVSWSDELFNIFEVPKENFDPSFQGYLNRLLPEMRQKIEEIVRHSKETGADFTFENKVKTSKGERYILSHGRVVKGTHGEHLRMRGTCQDITDRKKIESELLSARSELEKRVEERTLQLEESLEREIAAKKIAENASQAKMQFLANMSHEIRTPMNSILGFADLLITEDYSPAETKKYLGRIASNGAQLLRLIDDILDLSKFEAGHIPIQKNTFILQSFVDNIVNSFSPTLKNKGITLQVSVSNNLPREIYSDNHRLGQIFTNLLNNSIKFSEGGLVRLTLTYMSKAGVQYMQVDIEDSGIGILPENQKVLFEPFKQGDSSIARKYGGSGLGLALSKRIAEALGGQLGLKKSSPGKGSHFSFYVPVSLPGTLVPGSTAAVEPAPTVDAHASPADEAPLGPLQTLSSSEVIQPEMGDGTELAWDKKSILLVEDSHDNAVLVCHYLRPLNLHIDMATDGLQAVKMATQNVYDCILMDIQMPYLDGLEATRQIRATGYSKPIIALTAHALPSEYQRSIEAGCNLHLTKPIRAVDLIKALRNYIH